MSEQTGRDAAGFVVPSTVLWQDVGGDVVMLNVQTEQYYSLDPVASRIVAHLTTLPHDAAITALRSEFDIDDATLARDIERLVADLLDAGLLHRP